VRFAEFISLAGWAEDLNEAHGDEIFPAEEIGTK
jgi:hypothetical protein